MFPDLFNRIFLNIGTSKNQYHLELRIPAFQIVIVKSFIILLNVRVTIKRDGCTVEYYFCTCREPVTANGVSLWT